VSRPHSGPSGGIHSTDYSACTSSALGWPHGEYPRSFSLVCLVPSRARCESRWALSGYLTKNSQKLSAHGSKCQWEILFLNFRMMSSTYSPVKHRWMYVCYESFANHTNSRIQPAIVRGNISTSEEHVKKTCEILCAVGLGRADLWSNPEFCQFRGGFDIVLTDPGQDLHSLVGVSIPSHSRMSLC